MGTPLTDDEFGDALLTFTETAFRLELQAAYEEPVEREPFTKFLAGQLECPSKIPAFRQWFEQISHIVGTGRRIERVRVHDEPQTNYQRWERWVGEWNIQAGETIHYLSRQRAREVGLLPAAGHDDWWLFDSSRLIIMRFDDQHYRVGNELVADQDNIERACAWRDLAVRAATEHVPVAAA